MNTSLFPTYLWVGSPDQLNTHTYEFLHRHLCQDTTKTCMSCITIQLKQHPNVLWFSPGEKMYTLGILEPLFEQLRLQCAPEQHRFFIIQQAHLLPDSCSNSLLKSLEEPPSGYHFILLTHQPEMLLATIKSRCLITILSSSLYQRPTHPFLPFFSESKSVDPVTFTKTVAASSFNELEYADLLEQLFHHWTKQLKQTERHQTEKIKHIQNMLAVVQSALIEQPQPGGAKIALKNLLLSFYQATNP